MKILFGTLFLVGISIFCFAQTDSTENNLQRYKDLHEKGLISDQEYETLKKKELNLLEVPPAKKDTVNLNALKKKSRGQIIAGSLSLIVGFTNIGLGFYFHGRKDVRANPNGAPIVTTYETQSRTTFAAGAIFGACGIVLMANGFKLRAKYINGISVSPTSASITLRFLK